MVIFQSYVSLPEGISGLLDELLVTSVNLIITRWISMKFHDKNDE